jgi:hypothetical protein
MSEKPHGKEFFSNLPEKYGRTGQEKTESEWKTARFPGMWTQPAHSENTETLPASRENLRRFPQCQLVRNLPEKVFRSGWQAYDRRESVVGVVKKRLRF